MERLPVDGKCVYLEALRETLILTTPVLSNYLTIIIMTNEDSIRIPTDETINFSGQPAAPGQEAAASASIYLSLPEEAQDLFGTSTRKQSEFLF